MFYIVDLKSQYFQIKLILLSIEFHLNDATGWKWNLDLRLFISKEVDVCSVSNVMGAAIPQA